MKIEHAASFHRERALVLLAVSIMLLFALSLNLSSVVRSGTLSTERAWQSGIGFLVWASCLGGVWFVAQKTAPERDPYLLPSAFLLMGWGLMTLWRLSPYHAQRQTIWLVISSLVMMAILKAPADLSYLRRFKYLWLSGGLVLVFATLIFGANPAGEGLPRLWLGCCGIYLQPSEPMKLLLIVYLAAYLAVSQPFFQRAVGSKQRLAVLAPSLVMSLLAVSLLVVQRDLGTASLFFFLSAVLFYFATEQRWILLLGGMGILFGLGIGIVLFDVVRWRVEAWLNPYADPIHRSYQIVQSLIAVANGGLFGRGLGLGYPGQVPVPHSDFIFAAIAEESGLIGSLALLGCLALLSLRVIGLAMQSEDRFQRFLMIGIAAYFGGQSLLIIGGNLRLLPLTGVTLPFVSYGGSSLLVSCIMLGLALQVSHSVQPKPGILPNPTPYLTFGGILLLGFVAVALANGWFALYRAPVLLARTDNARRYIYEQLVQRGTIYDRELRPLAISERQKDDGVFVRRVLYPPLSPLIGYSHPVYGQSGLERSLDEWLSGERGYRISVILWQRLLTGTPPPGIAVRLTLNLELQQTVDRAMSGQRGAAVVVNAQNGEILAIASQPAFDSNRLATELDSYLKDANAPLLNRAFQGRYAIGALGPPLFPKGIAALQLRDVRALGLPDGLMDDRQPASDEEITPLQAACAAAAISNGGIRLPLQLVDAFHLPNTGWVPIQAETGSLTVYSPSDIELFLKQHTDLTGLHWHLSGTVYNEEVQPTSWYIAGTAFGWEGTPLAIVIVLEGGNEAAAHQVGEIILNASLSTVK
jgi:cell division protein FtsW (lipid II flippase)